MPFGATHNYPLVAVSIIVAIIASYVALALADAAWKTENKHHLKRWLYGSALALGLGIWTMHFIAMLAFELPTPVHYNGIYTALSMVVAVTASFLGIFVAHARNDARNIFLGGIIMAAGIVGMHYTGMWAMCLKADMHFRPVVVMFSIFIAMTASWVALWLLVAMETEKTLKTHTMKWLISLTMGMAISGVHYTGMAAVSFIPNNSINPGPYGFMIEGQFIPITLAGAAIALILLALYMVISEQRLSERLTAELARLGVKEARLRTFIEYAPDAFFAHDENGWILDVNKVACTQLGYTRDELLSMTLFDITLSKDKSRLINVVWPALIRNASHTTIDAIFIHKDGSQFPVAINMSGLTGNTHKYVFALARDVTETEKLKAHLSQLAMTDELTGIYNRRAFLDFLCKALSGAGRNHKDLSVLMMNIDFFKRVNDQYGHHIGDMVLQHVVNTTKKELRTEDIFGRLGGEEFAVLLLDSNIDLANHLAERLRKAVEDAFFEHDGIKISLTISIGIATPGSQKLTSTTLVRNADHALYEAKRGGRNRVAVFGQQPINSSTDAEPAPI